MSRRLFIRKLINSGSPSNSSLLSLLIIYPYATKLTRNRILSFSLRKSRRSQAKQRFKILGKEQSRFWNEISIIPRRKSPSIIARFKKLRKLIRMAVSQHWEHKKRVNCATIQNETKEDPADKPDNTRPYTNLDFLQKFDFSTRKE